MLNCETDKQSGDEEICHAKTISPRARGPRVDDEGEDSEGGAAMNGKVEMTLEAEHTG